LENRRIHGPRSHDLERADGVGPLNHETVWRATRPLAPRSRDRSRSPRLSPVSSANNLERFVRSPRSTPRISIGAPLAPEVVRNARDLEWLELYRHLGGAHQQPPGLGIPL